MPKLFLGRPATFVRANCGDREEKKDAHEPAALTLMILSYKASGI